MAKLGRLAYMGKYTAGSYLDAFMSVPIGVGEMMAKGFDGAFGDNNPSFLSYEFTHERSEIRGGREKLREKLDTRSGAVFVQSNLIGAVPFVVAGARHFSSWV